MESTSDDAMNLSEKVARRQTTLERSILASGLPPWHSLSPEERATAPHPELFRAASSRQWRWAVKIWLDEMRRIRSAQPASGVHGVPEDRPSDLWLLGVRARSELGSLPE